MRSFLLIRLFTLLVLATLLKTAALAGEVVVHLPEDAPPGTTIAQLGELLELQADEHVQLIGRHDGRFRIEDGRTLVVAPRARLDHESHSQHHLLVRIVPGPPGDATKGDRLQDKFEDLVEKDQDPGGPGDDRTDDADTAARSAEIRVLVDDVAEAPLLLGSRFRVPGSASPAPGQRIGRAVAIDLDSNEQHRFELLEGDERVRIDAVTGELFLRDDVDPLWVATLQVRVRVTDRAGLSAEAWYPVLLNDCPPAPPLPELLADTNPGSAGQTDHSTDAAVPPAPPEVAKTPGPDQQVTRADLSTPNTGEASTAAVPAAHHLPRLAVESTAGRWMSRIRQFLSRAGAGPLGDHPHGWLITLAVVVCVAVIVISGVRNAIQAGQVRLEGPPPAPAASPAQPVSTPILRSPSEISEILARLDAVIGKSEFAPDVVESTHSPRMQEETLQPLEHDVETALPLALPSLGMVRQVEPAAAVAPAVRYFPATETEAANAEALRGAGSPQAAVVSGVALDERQRMEQFRRISRMMNRADIGRHHRVRLRHEWMSIGVTSLACVITGTVCVFTSCFGAMSVPLGSVMFSVAAVLLMRPDLYPDFSSEEEADWARPEQQ